MFHTGIIFFNSFLFHQFTVQSNWDVVLKDSASKVFGHRTKNSQEYVFAGKDFHKSYQLVYSFTEAGVKVFTKCYSVMELLL